MTDYSILPLGVDVSHYQGPIDWPTLKAAGAGYAIIKATQGMAVDPMFLVNASAAADAGFITFAYPFVTAGDDRAVVDHFLDVTGGMVPALDVETPGIPDDVVDLYMDGYESRSGRAGLYYRGIYPVAPLTERQLRWPWWLPEYASAPRAPAWDGVSAPDWSKEWLIWQWSGNGREPGVTETIDLNRCAVPLDVLRRWHDTGSFSGGSPVASSLPNPTSPTS